MRNALRAFMAVVLGVTVVVAVPALAQDPVAEVSVGENFFSPEAVTVQAGDTVQWNWVGGFHSVVSDDGLFDSGAQATDGSTPFEFTFEEPGTYEYFCSIHSSATGSSQNGVITVTGVDDTPTANPTDQPVPLPGDDGDPVDVDGTDPVATALSWSGLLPDGGATTAFIGTAGGFADSLASGPGQGLLSAPLLLTDTETLDQRVIDELDRLGVTRVIILGGTAAISQEVQDQLAGLVDTVDRAGGATRLETARAVADLVAPDATTVILARAFGEGSAAFADSLGAGALGATDGWPVVLVGDTVDDGLAAWLAARGVQTIYLVGGTAAIPMGVADTLSTDYEVIRAAGATRTATAAVLLGIGSGGDTSTVVEGFGDLAWASGFAAALHATDGILLSNAGSATLPGDTVRALLGDGRRLICGPTLDANTCAQARTASSVDTGDVLRAVMDVDQEPDAQPTGASGIATIYRVPGEGGICTTASASSLSGPITAAHIHAGEFGVAGGVVIPLGYSTADGTALQYGCTGPGDASAEAVDGVSANPQGHYLNLHTELNPAGEIRGQLFVGDDAVTADLTGAAEVPGPGDPQATGSARVFDTGVAGELCYAVAHDGLSPAPTAAHIHEGAADAAGGVVHPLVLGSAESSWHCDRGVDASLRDDILANPDNYYVNVHNVDFPAGAIRGQLGVDATG